MYDIILGDEIQGCRYIKMVVCMGIEQCMAVYCMKVMHGSFAWVDVETSWLPSKKESNTLGGKILKILDFKDRGISKFGEFFSQFLTLGQSLIIIFQLS